MSCNKKNVIGYMCPHCGSFNNYRWIEDSTLRCDNCDELFEAYECEVRE